MTVESEDLITGNKQIALTAFFTMVSLDENGKPSPVPKLVYDEIMRMRVNYIKSAKKSTFCIMRENLNI